MWVIGMLVGWCILGIIVIFFILSQFFYSAYRWVNDKEQNVVFTKYFQKYNLNDEKAIGGIFLIFVGSAIWPIAIPAILLFVSLYSLRGFIRFRKKVNKALHKLNKLTKEDRQ